MKVLEMSAILGGPSVHDCRLLTMAAHASLMYCTPLVLSPQRLSRETSLISQSFILHNPLPMLAREALGGLYLLLKVHQI